LPGGNGNPVLFDGDPADHAIPIVIGAPEIVGPEPVSRQEQILGLAGLHHNLGMLAIENFGIADIGRGEKRRRRDFVRFLAVVFHVQPVMHVVLKDQMIWYELVVDHEEIELDRLRLRPGYWSSKDDCREREQGRYEDLKHCRNPLLSTRDVARPIVTTRAGQGNAAWRRPPLVNRRIGRKSRTILS